MIRIRPLLSVTATLLVLSATMMSATTMSAPAHGQESIPWVTDLAQARQMAEQQQRLVLLHFWGDGCQPCQVLENSVFNQPELIRVISTSFVPVKIHVQQQPQIANHYKITQIPTDIIVLPNGAQVFRTTSPATANAYLSMLDQARADALSSGLQFVDRTARNVAEQLAPLVPSLPPRTQDEAPTSQTVNTPWGNSGQQAVSPPAPSSPAPGMAANSPGAMTSNAFVGPLDQRAPASPPAVSTPRQQNPYVNEPLVAPGGRPESTPAFAPVAPAITAKAPGDATGAPPAGPAASPDGIAAAGPIAGPSPTTPPGQRWSNLQASAGEGTSNNRYAPATPAGANEIAQGTPPALSGSQGAVGATTPPGVSPSMGPAPTRQPAANLPQLPPGVPPLALDGFCPVTLMNVGKWEKGDPRFGVVHRDRTYLFKSQSERDRFLAPAAADRFAPVLSGLDPVRFTDLGQSVDGRREHGVLFDGQIYLFADEEALSRFEQQPQRYVAAVHQAMAGARTATSPQR